MGNLRNISVIAGTAITVLGMQGCAQTTGDDDTASVEWDQITYITPYAPGGSTDAVSRTFAPLLAEELGTTSIVVNRPGGDEVVGLTSVVTADPDGHTLGLSTPVGVAVQPLLVEDLPFAEPSQYTNVALMAEAPFALLVRADAPWQTLEDLVEAAKNAPGQLNIASTGRRTLNSYVIAAFENESDIDVNLVPFESAAEAQTSTLGDKTDAFVAVATAQVEMVESGELRALAVTGEDDYEKLPDATTFTAAGYDVPFTSAYLTLAAPDLPEDVAASLGEAVDAVLASDEWLDWCAERGFTPKSLVSSEMADWVTQQQAALKPVIDLVEE